MSNYENWFESFSVGGEEVANNVRSYFTGELYWLEAGPGNMMSFSEYQEPREPGKTNKGRGWVSGWRCK